MNVDLKGQVAVVTGGSRGIGRGIAEALARNGATCVVTGRNEKRLKEVETVLREMETSCRAAVLHVEDMTAVDRFAKEIYGDLGRIDILVNNAGITDDQLLLRMKEEQWDRVLETNLKGVFNCTKAVARYMLKKKYGRIVNISSVIALMGNPGQANYAASKAGIIGFTKAVARELARKQITVNAIAPGYIQTEMTEKMEERAREGILSLIPQGRLGSVEDVAHAVLFLVSDAASYITGHVLNVSGGLYI
jgi:3-oxoacyl-[acyl-carrier protein] reductase